MVAACRLRAQMSVRAPSGLRLVALAAATLAAAPCARADLPVHCVHRDIVGVWEVARSGDGDDASEHCGHVFPDRVMTMPAADVRFASPGFTADPSRSFHVQLCNPNTVRLLPAKLDAAAAAAAAADGDCGGAVAEPGAAAWTTVYDEGFDIDIDGHNVSDG